MGALEHEMDPEEVGFDTERTARSGRHLSRYVDDGRLPPWLVLLALPSTEPVTTRAAEPSEPSST